MHLKLDSIFYQSDSKLKRACQGSGSEPPSIAEYLEHKHDVQVSLESLSEEPSLASGQVVMVQPAKVSVGQHKILGFGHAAFKGFSFDQKHILPLVFQVEKELSNGWQAKITLYGSLENWGGPVPTTIEPTHATSSAEYLSKLIADELGIKLDSSDRDYDVGSEEDRVRFVEGIYEAKRAKKIHEYPLARLIFELDAAVADAEKRTLRAVGALVHGQLLVKVPTLQRNGLLQNEYRRSLEPVIAATQNLLHEEVWPRGSSEFDEVNSIISELTTPGRLDDRATEPYAFRLAALCLEEYSTRTSTSEPVIDALLPVIKEAHIQVKMGDEISVTVAHDYAEIVDDYIYDRDVGNEDSPRKTNPLSSWLAKKAEKATVLGPPIAAVTIANTLCPRTGLPPDLCQEIGLIFSLVWAYLRKFNST